MIYWDSNVLGFWVTGDQVRVTDTEVRDTAFTNRGGSGGSEIKNQIIYLLKRYYHSQLLIPGQGRIIYPSYPIFQEPAVYILRILKKIITPYVKAISRHLLLSYKTSGSDK